VLDAMSQGWALAIPPSYYVWCAALTNQRPAISQPMLQWLGLLVAETLCQASAPHRTRAKIAVVHWTAGIAPSNPLAEPPCCAPASCVLCAGDWC